MRTALGSSIVSLGLLVACGEDPAPVDAGFDAGPPGVDAGPVVFDAGEVTRIAETEAEAGRTGCAFTAGAMPWETIGEEYPIGEEIPIRHFIILMQENRSFDSYFGTMPGVEGLPVDAQNPDDSGTPVTPFHATEYCTRDPSHSWNGSHRQYTDGTNQGFVTTNGDDGARVMGYFDRTDLPFYWNLAETFAMSDHHHCSLLAPTWVNRMFFVAGSSYGKISNQPVDLTRVPLGRDHVIYEQLDRRGVSWGIYYDVAPFVYAGFPHWALIPSNRNRIRELPHFFEDLDAGTLPEVVYLDPTWSGAGGVDATDEHPPANPQRGQAWVRDIVARVMASDIWRETAIIFTYDEHGGFYDHVPPPEACPPGDYPPDLTDTAHPGDFDRLGFRVPMMIISPYSRPGYVSARVTDHASVLRLLQARYLLPALSSRDANAWPLLDMFDFENPAFMTPPTLVEAPVDEAAVTACHAAFPD